MKNFKEYIVDKIQEVTEMEREEIFSLLELPPKAELGDYAMPMFKLAAKYKKAPPLIAQELLPKFESDHIIERVEQVGPYLNFFIRDRAYFQEIFKELEEDKFASSNIGEGKTRIVEFSSTNIAKPFHIGHLRSTMIGNAIRNILDYQGYNTVAINYIGDYGTQFGMMIEAYKLWGDDEKINADPIPELLKLYVKYNELAKEDVDYLDKARAAFNKLEQKDEESLKLWSWFRELSLEEFQRVYKMLGVDFDSFNGEYYHSQFIPQVIEELKEKNLLVESDGAQIVDLEKYDLTPAIIIKSDGSSTYIARDIATAIYRKEKYDFEENLYVVASEQNLHFQQLRAILKEMGRDIWKDTIHIPFGLISLKDGSMSTRGGQVIFLEDVLNQSIDKTKEIIESRNPDLENKEEVAKKVGIGAVIFQDLFNSRIRDYVFDWDQILNFDGETGPYTQYSYARAQAVLRKASYEGISNEVNVDLFKEAAEIDLAKHIYQFREVLLAASERYEPSLVTRFAVECAQLFNRFYAQCPVLTAEEEVREARLALTYLTQKVLAIALNLIGLEVVEQM